MFNKLAYITVILSLSAGCTTMLDTKPAFNPIVTDADFQKTFQSHPIRSIAPASGIESEVIEQLRSITHFKINIPDNIVENKIIFHANADEERFLQLKNALYDKSPHTIIWTLRGGYGSARLIEKLRQCPKPETEKIFIGYSDITALHLFLSQHWHWHTIHGDGLAKLLTPTQDPQNFKRIASIISKKEKNLTLDPLIPLNKEALDTKKISGRITGGNLSIIQTSIGTPWQIQTAGKILFIEEVSEKGYRIDRILNHLKQSGILKKVKGIVFGQLISFLDTVDLPTSEDITVALERFATETNIPVFKSNQFGHGHTNYPLIYNAPSEIVLNKETCHFSLIMHF
jgi:muramoyltetrapeptide carboxypeptidase